jgi:hypothetical protein
MSKAGAFEQPAAATISEELHASEPRQMSRPTCSGVRDWPCRHSNSAWCSDDGTRLAGPWHESTELPVVRRARVQNNALAPASVDGNDAPESATLRVGRGYGLGRATQWPARGHVATRLELSTTIQLSFPFHEGGWRAITSGKCQASPSLTYCSRQLNIHRIP